MRRYLEAGRLNSPRGIKGELRFACWCDSPEFLEGVRTFYLDAEGMRPLRVVLYRPSIPSLIFEGYEDRSRASQLVNRTIYFDREDVSLPEGVVYNDDLLGLPVFDTDGARLGSLTACAGCITSSPAGKRAIASPSWTSSSSACRSPTASSSRSSTGWSCERAAASFQSKGGAVL